MFTTALYTGALPKILWGVGFANTLELGRPLEQVKAYSDPAAGLVVTDSLTGSLSAFAPGHDEYLEAVVKAIPRVDTATSYGVTATGWEGDLGWEGFLEFTFSRPVLRFYPSRVDSTYVPCYLMKPWKDAPTVGWFFHRDVEVTFKSADRTLAFSGY